MDCETNQPISGALVSLSQSDWGRADEGYLIWDKVSTNQTLTNDDGSFEISFFIKSSLNVGVKKEGYYFAVNYFDQEKDVIIKIRKLQNLSASTSQIITYDCKLSTECYVTKIENNIKRSWNNCTSPD